MIERGPARECEIVVAFLQAEIDSDRYGQIIRDLLAHVGGGLEPLIRNPDLQSDLQNSIRGWLLSYRGFERREALFLGFPPDACWRSVELEPPELDRLKYALEPNWMQFSENTRKPRRVWDRIAKGELAEDPGKRVKAIQEKLKNGERFPPLVAVEGQGGDLILIEGHSRATAYVGLPWKENLRVFLGSSRFMHGWRFY